MSCSFRRAEYVLEWPALWWQCGQPVKPLCTSWSVNGTPATPSLPLLDSSTQKKHFMFKNTILPHAVTKNTLLWAVPQETGHHADNPGRPSANRWTWQGAPCLGSGIGVSKASKRAMFCTNSMLLGYEVTDAFTATLGPQVAQSTWNTPIYLALPVWPSLRQQSLFRRHQDPRQFILKYSASE
jgi:hypothetical protein